MAQATLVASTKNARSPPTRRAGGTDGDHRRAETGHSSSSRVVPRRSKAASPEAPVRRNPRAFEEFSYGSDGTRTRDLRRDRPAL